MILKASQRGGGKQLAQHLLNAIDNEHVEVHSMRGFTSDDLTGAMKEAHAISLGTRCRQFLFSISLNPPEEASVSPETFEEVLARIEAKTGLEGQPRAVVLHTKEARTHCHAVYSRIDAESMRAVNMAHFKLKLRDISRDLYLENEWRLPKGLMNSEARDPRNYTLAEYQQSKRMGRDARDLKQTIQECWAASDGKAAFQAALAERGMILAKGDRRGHVIVPHEGEALSVARYTGKKAKDVRAKLGEPENLPSVEAAKTELAQGVYAALGRHIKEAKRQHRDAMTPLEARREAMTAEHRDERRTLLDRQRMRWEVETRERAARLNTGLRGLWDRVTGRHRETQSRNLVEAHAALKRDQEQRGELVAAQSLERRELQLEIKAARRDLARHLRELRADRLSYSRELGPQTAPSTVHSDLEGARARVYAKSALSKRFDRYSSLKAPIKKGDSNKRAKIVDNDPGHDLES